MTIWIKVAPSKIPFQIFWTKPFKIELEEKTQNWAEVVFENHIDL